MIAKPTPSFAISPYVNAALFFFTLGGANVQADIHLKFGVYTAEQPTAMVAAYRPILSALESRLTEKLDDSVKISLQISSSYEKGVDSLVKGAVDFSMLGAASYIEATERNPGLRILALDSKDGSRTFNGVICVAEDSPLQSIEQLKGKSFAFGNKRSTIGRYLSQAYLVSHGIIDSDLKTYKYLGRHDRVGHAVAQGTFDAGALREGTFNKLIKKGAKLRALVTFPNANRAWVASEKMPVKLRVALRQTMLGLTDTSLFKPFKRKQFVVGYDGDFDRIRHAIKNNGEFFSRTDRHSNNAHAGMTTE